MAATSLRQNRRGVAALEFALIAPVLLLFLMGVVEFTNAFRIQAKLNTAAGQLAELVAGQQYVTGPDGSLADICTGAAMNIAPFTASSLSANIASVTNDHPSNRVPLSTDKTSVVAYLDWENVSSCAASASTLGGSGVYNLANSPRSLLTKSGMPAASQTDLQYGYSAIVVRAQYVYTNVLPFFLNKFVTFSSIAVSRPRSNVVVQCKNTAETASCPITQ